MLRLALVATILLFAACEPRPPAAQETDARDQHTSGNDVVATVERCRNPEAGYSVAYPADWRVSTGETMPPCSAFDPEPLVIPPDSEVPADIAVVIGLAGVPFETVAHETMGERVLSREETTVGGHQAVRIESVTTGEGLFDAGLHGTRYVIDLGDRVLVAETRDVGEPDYAEKQRALEAMVASLEFEAGR
jgi:hypothetical protein